MEVLKRLMNLGRYLTGELIIIDVSKNSIDAGLVEPEKQHKAAVEFFHKVYTRKS